MTLHFAAAGKWTSRVAALAGAGDPVKVRCLLRQYVEVYWPWPLREACLYVYTDLRSAAEQSLRFRSRFWLPCAH